MMHVVMNQTTPGPFAFLPFPLLFLPSFPSVATLLFFHSQPTRFRSQIQLGCLENAVSRSCGRGGDRPTNPRVI